MARYAAGQGVVGVARAEPDVLISQLEALFKEAKEKTGLDKQAFLNLAGIPYSTSWSWFKRAREGRHPSRDHLVKLVRMVCQVLGEPFGPRLQQILSPPGVLVGILDEHGLPASIEQRVMEEVGHAGPESYPDDAAGSALIIASLAPLRKRAQHDIAKLKHPLDIPSELLALLGRLAYHSRDTYFRPVVEALRDEHPERYEQLMTNLDKLAEVSIEERRRAHWLDPLYCHVLSNSLSLAIGLGRKELADKILSQVRGLWTSRVHLPGDAFIAREAFRSAASRSHYDRLFLPAAQSMIDLLEMTVRDRELEAPLGWVSLGCEYLYFEPGPMARGILVPELSCASSEEARVVLRNILRHMLEPEFGPSKLNYSVMLWLFFKVRGGTVLNDVDDDIVRTMRQIRRAEEALLAFDPPFENMGHELRNKISQVLRGWQLRLQWLGEQEAEAEGG